MKLKTYVRLTITPEVNLRDLFNNIRRVAGACLTNFEVLGASVLGGVYLATFESETYIGLHEGLAWMKDLANDIKVEKMDVIPVYLFQILSS